MSFIKQKQNVTLSPIGVRSFDTGAQNVWNTVSAVADEFQQIALQDAIAKGREEAENAAYAVNASSFKTFDTDGNPIALKVPEEYGRIRRDVYLNIVNQRYDQIVAQNIRQKSREFAFKYPDPTAYNNMMEGFVNSTYGAAEGRFKETVFRASSEEVAETKLTLQIAQEKARVEQVKLDAQLNYINEVEELTANLRSGVYYGKNGNDKYAEDLQKVVNAESRALQVTNDHTQHRKNRDRRLKVSASYAVSKLSNETKDMKDSQKEAIAASLENRNFATLIENDDVRNKVLQIIGEFETVEPNLLSSMYSGSIESYQKISEASEEEFNDESNTELRNINSSTSQDMSSTKDNTVKLNIAVMNYNLVNERLSENPALNKGEKDKAEDYIRKALQSIIEEIPKSIYDKQLVDQIGLALASNTVPNLDDYIPAALEESEKRVYRESLGDLASGIQRIHKSKIPLEVRNSIFETLKDYNNNRIEVEKANNTRISNKEAAILAQEKAIAKANKEANDLVIAKQKTEGEIANSSAFGKFEERFKALIEKKDFDGAADVLRQFDEVAQPEYFTNDQWKKYNQLQEQAKNLNYKKSEFVKKENKDETTKSLTSEINSLETRFIENKDDPEIIVEAKKLLEKVDLASKSLKLEPSTENTLKNPLQALLKESISHKQTTQREQIEDNYAEAIIDLIDYNYSGDHEELTKRTDKALDAFSKLPPQTKEDKLAKLNKSIADKIEPILFAAISKETNGRGFSEEQLLDIEEALQSGKETEFLKKFKDKPEAAVLEILGRMKDYDINIDPFVEDFKKFSTALRKEFDKGETLARKIDRGLTLGSVADKEDIDAVSSEILNPLLGDGSSNPVQYFSTKKGAFYAMRGGVLTPTEYMKQVDGILNSGLIPKEIVDFLEMSATNPPQTTEGQENLFHIYSKLTQGGAVGIGYNLLNNKQMPYQVNDNAKAILGAAFVDFDTLANAGGSSSFGLSLVRMAGEASQMDGVSLPQSFNNVIGKAVNKFLRDNFAEADIKTQRLLTNVSYALLPNIKSEDMLVAKLNKFIESSYGKDERMLGPTLSGSVAQARTLRFNKQEIRRMDDGIEEDILNLLDPIQKIRLTKSKPSTIKSMLELELEGKAPIVLDVNWKLKMIPNSDNMAMVMMPKNGRFEPFMYTEEIEQDGETGSQTLPMVVNLLDYIPYPKADISRLTETYYTRYRAVMQDSLKSDNEFTLGNFAAKAIGFPTKDDLFGDPTGGTEEGARAFMAYKFALDPTLLKQQENKEILDLLVKEKFMTKEDANILVGASRAD